MNKEYKQAYNILVEIYEYLQEKYEQCDNKDYGTKIVIAEFMLKILELEEKILKVAYKREVNELESNN